MDRITATGPMNARGPVRTRRLVLREMIERPGSFVAGALGIGVAATLVTFLWTLAEAHQRETRRVTRDLGFNLRVVPRAASVSDILAGGIPDGTLPESALEALVSSPDISFNHLVAMLHREVTVDGEDVILTGLSDEVYPPGRRKPPMVRSIRPGGSHVGAHVAARAGLETGGTVRLLDRTFRVDGVLAATGGADDIRILVRLDEAQELLGLPGRVSEVQALECLCLSTTGDTLRRIASRVEDSVPDARVLLLHRLAEVRARQRRGAEAYAAALLPIAVAAAAIWTALLSWMNVRQRLAEIGVLRAVGVRGRAILGLFLARALAVGAAGGAAGAGLGALLARALGPSVFPVTGEAIHLSWPLLGSVLAGAPLLGALAGLVPATWAATRDPAAILGRDE